MSPETAGFRKGSDPRFAPLSATLFSPAKVNLYLAVTGRRPDGYHDLVSVAVTLDFGDDLEVEARESAGRERFVLDCDDAAVPRGPENLVLRAAEAFAAAVPGWRGGARFRLAKRIPPGAGLGGGSSNAVAALRGLNRLAGTALPDEKLEQIAAALGSDCALFVRGGAVLMRGRGERVESLPPEAAQRLAGRRVVLFKPSFSVSTSWAYGRLAQRGGDYVRPAEAERRVANWISGAAEAEALLANNLEASVGEKYLAIPLLLRAIESQARVPGRMSGSGSACFALVHGSDEVRAVVERVRDAWGEPAFVREASIA